MKSPGTGVYSASELDPRSHLSKAMYYMYGGPGYEQYIKSSLTGGWGEDANAYCLTHCVLSYIYDGCDQNSAAFKGLNADISVPGHNRPSAHFQKMPALHLVYPEDFLHNPHT